MAFRATYYRSNIMSVILRIFWALLAVLLFPLVALSQTTSGLSNDGLRFVTVTGRAAIIHEDALDEARDMAIEDALYYAVLKGGAKIDGFTSVDAQTNLNDMFVVRPVSQILDYSITNEIQDGTHYAVTVDAVVGDMVTSGCQNRPVSQVTLFRPAFQTAIDLPHWMSQLPGQLTQVLAVQLSKQPTLRLRDARKVELAAATTPDNPLNQFDYTQLTSGRVMMHPGDFALQTKVSLKSQNESKFFSKTEYAVIEIESTLVEGFTNTLREQIRDEFKLQLGKRLPLRSLTILNKETREAIRALVVMAADTHAEKIAERLTCLPMTSRLNIADGRLQAKLGSRQGLSLNHLGFAEGRETPWTILRVIEAHDNNVVLTPLDTRRNIGELEGVEVTFLEFD